MEVFRNAENQGFSLRDIFRLVSPFAGDLDGGFDGFGASVHGHDHVKVEILCDELGEAGEDIIVECSRA